jgi:hypothetical protein
MTAESGPCPECGCQARGQHGPSATELADLRGAVTKLTNLVRESLEDVWRRLEKLEGGPQG